MFDGVNSPAEDDLLHAPGSVAFANIFEEDWLLLCSVLLNIWPEEFDDAAKKVSRHFPSFVWTSLYFTNEVIDVYFNVSSGCGTRVWGQGFPVVFGF